MTGFVMSITRVPISLPCQVRVLPDSGITDSALESTELCATDAWWMVGTGFLCDQHLREVLGDHYDEIVGDIPLNSSERLPWEQRHRYSQDQADPDTTSKEIQ